ncbi:MAG: PTS system mannose/fructose/sorbose family transporter subunit IID [Mycoplasmatales bacterium]
MKTKKNKVFFRWLLTNSMAWNYEKYQGLGYAASMIPALKEIYKDDPEGLHQAVHNHMQFFNSNATTAPLIIGATLAMEEELPGKSTEAIAGLKTGLMGALAGIGDTLFNVLPTTIFGAIASYMALEGSAVGVIIFIGYFLLKDCISYYFMNLGYREGTKLVTTLSGKLKNITKAANAIGILVVGGLIPSVVSATVAYTYTNGDVTVALQDSFDKIMPGLIPLIIVALTYWMLGQKKLNSTRVIFILLLAGIVLHALQILA